MVREFPLATVLTARDAASPKLRALSATAQQLGNRLQSVGRTMSTAVAAPAAALGFSIGKTVIGFESSMNRVQALTNATGEEFAKLNEKALQIGESTQFSASEAAEGMALLALQGNTTSEILSSLGSAMNLAGAGQMQIGEAVMIMSSGLNQFGMDASEAAKMADILAYTASTSATDVRQLGNAMEVVGAISRSAGVSLSETNAILGALADQGKRGEKAGTALKGVMERLLNPVGEASKSLQRLGIDPAGLVGADGKLVSLTDTLVRLSDAAATPGDLFKIFGAEASSAVASLMGELEKEGSGALALRRTNIELNSLGSAAKHNEANMQGLGGAWKNLMSKAESLRLAIGEAGLTDTLTKLADRLGEVIVWVKNLSPETIQTATNIVGWTSAISLATVALAPLVGAVSMTITVFGWLKIATLGLTKGLVFLAMKGLPTVAIGLFHFAMGAAGLARTLTSLVIPAVLRFGVALMANPIGLAVTAIAGLIVAGIALWKNWDRVAAGLASAWDWIKDTFVDGISWIAKKLNALGVGKLLGFLGFGGDVNVASAPDFDTSTLAEASGFGAPQNGRAAVRIDVNGGRQDVRVTATQVDDLDLELNQGLALGVIG